MEDCVFCNIVNRTLSSNILFESETIFVIPDIMPKAPVHFLVIPKKHIPSINELTEVDSDLIAEIVLAAKTQAQKMGIAEKGYKLVWNVGKEGGQIIPHLHLHVLGGKQLPE
ncbi:MAG: histidine triad nucleotide-binding protein [bacterium]|nr:histidine triad nucleotide-binding protein [bacterium]